MQHYYEENHQFYFDSTVNIDPAPFLKPLCQFLQPKDRILDIGCGSGRDLLWLSQQGFFPTGLEYSPNLARLAQIHSGCPVITGDYSRFDFEKLLAFDALLLIGALVHQPHSALADLLHSFSQALNSGGYLLISMKEGNGTQALDDGRQFTLWSRLDIEQVYTKCGLHIIDFNRQISKLRSEDIWLSHILRIGNDC